MQVIRNAKGLAIFTTMRTGLWVSGAGGSGVLVGRTADGSWSPPSGIMLHTAGLGFLVGVDIYDCVVVINTQNALDAFSKIRCTLGGEVSAVAGPVGAGGILETEIHKRQAPVFTYLKSRGFYAGIQIDGTVVIERTDENERFYGEKLSVGDILAGKVRHAPYETRKLLETIKAAQGDKDVDESFVPSEPPPGDFEIEDNHMFGIPDKEDPDPYGVLALEKEGFGIREAGSQKRASWEQFTFQPSPTSPIYSTYSGKSQDRDSRSIMTLSRQSSWKRDSANSHAGSRLSGVTTVDGEKEKRPVVMREMSTQTDFSEPPSPSRSSTRSSPRRTSSTAMDDIPEDGVATQTPVRKSPSPPRRVNGHQRSSSSRSNTPPKSRSPRTSIGRPEQEHDADVEESADDTDVHIEEPTVHSIQKAAAPQVISKARLVTVAKRAPPRLPPRNPNRRGPLVINADSAEVTPTSATASPMTPRSRSPTTVRGGWSNPASPVKSIGDGVTPSDITSDSDAGAEERNPWAKIMERRSRQGSPDSADMPGSFHSLPPTPDEDPKDAKA